MKQRELERRWQSTEGIAGVRYRFSDLVLIKSGKHTGKTAEVIALISLDPEPMYLVMCPPKEHPQALPQSELEPVGASTGRTIDFVRFNDQ